MDGLNTSKVSAEVANALSRLMAELILTAKENPLAIERIAKLADAPARDTRLLCGMLEILPDEIDAGQWLDWIEGGAAPVAGKPMVDPSRGQKKSARGAWQSAVRLRATAAQDVATARENLAIAEARHALCEQAVKEADAHLRAAVCYRLLIDESRIMAGMFAMGPAFTLLRAISAYQRRDPVFEATLDEHGRAWIEEQIAKREDTARTIMEQLDFFAGDVKVEMKLHRAIQKVLAEAYADVEAERAEARAVGKPLSPLGKRTFRNHEQRRTSVRRTGLRNDYSAVLGGFRTGASSESNDEPSDTDE
ncbi:hypothetical protein ACFSC3_12980 [Sphingomonas floccifaciens]|uniref:Uncharacterized protein n=1 Tax=Sphingomonas floccifaciens TaxID=1844115 RepID=A0ABW4NG07_9SPHN|nr:hypothetical protein [Roseomonas aeriglobus]